MHIHLLDALRKSKSYMEKLAVIIFVENFPFRKARSHLDVGLANGLGDEEYLRMVDGLLENLFIERRLRPCDFELFSKNKSKI